MKKLKFIFNDLKHSEVLSKQQLKDIIGGSGSGGPTTDYCELTCDSHTTYVPCPGAVQGFGCAPIPNGVQCMIHGVTYMCGEI